MLQRIITVLERARVAGGWIDEDVARAVLREMREPPFKYGDIATRAFNQGGIMLGGESGRRAWRAMIDAALNEEPAHTSSEIGHG